MRLAGKTGIVTGGGSGIGRALALGAAGEGAQVLICGRREGWLRETAQQAPPRSGSLSFLALDLTEASAPEKLAGWVRSSGGKLDFLVNGAGISGVNYLDETTGEDLWDLILLTNLTVPYRLCRMLVPFMGHGGRILNISSVLGKFGVPGYSAYCSSKHGIVGMTRALAAELAPSRITVNAICPGWVETEMAAEGMARGAKRLGISTEEFRRDALGRIPLGRILQPEEISPLALYLLSEEAAGMTGQAINLCGGATTA